MLELVSERALSGTPAVGHGRDCKGGEDKEGGSETGARVNRAGVAAMAKDDDGRSSHWAAPRDSAEAKSVGDAKGSERFFPRRGSYRHS